MEGPPPQFTARTPDDYLEQLTKPVMQAGMNWRVVGAKWSGIKKGFHNFRAERVARMSDREIDTLMKDEKVIRSRPKLNAVVHNANALLELERAGGIKKHLRSFDDYQKAGRRGPSSTARAKLESYEELASDLKKRFKFVGDSGMYHFLWTVKHPVPEWHAWAKAHGLAWGEGVKMKKTKARPRATSRA